MPTRPHRRSGLTRLEFAVSLAIIGVLVAVALPRLQAPRIAARQVRLKMLLATARSSASLFHGRCEIERSRDAGNGCTQLAIEGQAVAGVNYWPSATPEGIVAALNRWSQAPDIDWQSERIDGVPALRARLRPVAAAGTCEFIYAQAASPGAAPRIALVAASCP
jgi:type II secretory pathway pseudopilin PulG